MAAGDLITGPEQIEWNSLLLGDTSAYGLLQVEGVASMPALDTSDRGRSRRHGLLPGDDFLASRVITAEISVATTDRTTGPEIAALLDATVTSDEAPLVMRWEGVGDNASVRCNARVRRREVPMTYPRWQRGRPTVVVQWEATDPRLYADSASSEQVSLPTATSGLSWALSWALDWGGVSTSNLITATNPGNFATPVTLTVAGACTNPMIENLTQSRTLSFDITLTAGQTLVIDTDARSVLLDGTADRYSTLDVDSTWFDLDPGGDELRFTATSGSGATLTAAWRAAYI